MEYALAVLLASSLTCAGLLAAWAAMSSQHWFLRAGVFVGVLSLLLLIPAYEPFVAFVLQGAVVAAGVWLVRFRKNKLAGTPPIGNRFSLATLLLAMVFVAIAAAVGSRLPALNQRAWQSVLLIGLTGGLATLLGLWVVAGRRGRWWLRAILVSAISILIALPLIWSDRFIQTIIDFLVWPPDDALIATLGYAIKKSIAVWGIVVLGIIWMVAGMCCSIGPSPLFDSPTRRYSAKHLFLKGLLFISRVLVIVPSVVVYYYLSTPHPIPEIISPNPNGYDDILAACEIAGRGKFQNLMFDYESVPHEEYALAIKEMQPAVKLLQIGLAKRARMPIDYSSKSYALNASSMLTLYVNQRALARSLNAMGRFSEQNNKIEDAAEYYLETIKLGYSLRQGCLANQAEIGIAISRMGYYGLFRLSGALDPQLCTRLSVSLDQLEKQVEPDREVIFRNRVWLEHSMGWLGHLRQILWGFLVKDDWRYEYSFIDASTKNLTIMRLLRLELTLRVWSETRSSFPQTLDELVPEYLPAVPVDPYDPAGGLLRYRLTEDGYILYSVGQNGVDEDGAKPAEAYDFSTADLSLDVLYADETVEEEVDGEDEFSEDGDVP